MKNKKILNICLLTFALIALITFILPIKKFAFLHEESTFITVMFYLLNGVMIACLVALIVLSIINLFKDNYSSVKLMECLALIGFLMVFVVLLIFACATKFRISVGYLLVAIELFVCANFSQMFRMVTSGSEFKSNLKEVFPNGKSKGKKERENSNCSNKGANNLTTQNSNDQLEQTQEQTKN